MKPALDHHLPRHHTLRLRPLAFALFGVSLCAFPGMGGAQVVVAGGNTKVYQAPNGVQVVDIATANAAGVSHNVYTEFNVARNGMVLNNGGSEQMTRQSQLAGQVSANLNLNGSAKIILNEVTGTRRSALAGHMEVLGSAAEIVIANPYGITCDGCGFINTPRVTLGTGVPVLDAAGRLTGLRVEGGDILVSGSGLNAAGVSYLDLVARSIRIDGQVNAADLALAAGANTWDYATRSATAAAAGANAPALGIDSSALGGMYANRIRLMSTEEGVGVRLLGNAAASAADLAIDAKGQITLQGRLSAQAGNIAVSAGGASGGIALSGRGASVSAGGDVALTTTAPGADIALDDASLRAGRDLRVNAGGALRDSADAGNGDALRHAGGDLSVTAGGAASIDGSSWGAEGSLAMRSAALNAGSGAIYSGKELTLSTTGGDLRLGAAGLTAHGALALDAGQGALRVGADGRVTGAGAIALEGAAVANAGTIIGERGIALNASSLDNSGLLQAAAGLGAEVRGAAVNSGSMLAGDALGLQAATLDNSGVLQSGAALGAAVDTRFLNSGKVLAAGNMAITGRDAGFALDNRGLIQAGGDLNLGDAAHAARLHNGAAGTIAASLDTLVLESLLNEGLIQARDGLLLSTTGDATNAASGLILARGQAGAQLAIGAGGALRNDGALQSDGSLALAAGGALANTGTAVTRAPADGGADGGITVRAAGIDNGGAIGAAGALDLVSLSYLDNQGTAQAGGPLSATLATTLTNGADGKLLSLGDVTIAGGGADFSLANDGRIQAGGALTVGGGAGRADLHNGAKASLQGQGATLALGGLVNERGGAIGSTGAGALAVNARAGIDNMGSIESGGAMTLGGAAIDNTGTLVTLGRAQGGADGDLTLTAGGALTNGGHVEAGGVLAIDNAGSSAGLENRNGAVLVGGTVRLRTGSLVNAGVVQADGSLEARVGGKLTNGTGGEMVAQGGTLDLAAGGSLVNEGALQAGQGISLVAADLLDNKSSMLALNGDLTLRALSVQNRAGGTVYGKGAVYIGAGTDIQNAGTLFSGAGMRLGGTAGNSFALGNTGTIGASGSLDLGSAAIRASVDNAGEVIAGSSKLWLTTLANTGTVRSDTTLGIDALDDIVNGSTVALPAGRPTPALQSGANLSLRTQGRVLNYGTVLGAGGMDMRAAYFLNTGSLLSGARLGLQGMGSDFMLDNRGRIQSATDLAIGDSAGLAELINAKDGVIVGGDLVLRTSALTNVGIVQGTNLDARSTNMLNNTAGARLLADGQGGTLTLDAGTLANGGEVQSGGDITAVADTIDNLQGGSFRTVAASPTGPAGGALSLTATSGALDNKGDVASNGSLALDGAGVANSGTVTSRGSLVVSTHDNFINNGRVAGGASLTLNSATGNFSVSNAATGTIESAGEVRIGTLPAAADISNEGKIFGNKVTVFGTQVANKGTASRLLGTGADAKVDLQVTQGLVNEGKLHSGGALAVQAAGIVNVANAAISAGGTVDLTATAGDLVNNGDLYATGQVSLRAAGHKIENGDTGSIDVKGAGLTLNTRGGGDGKVANYSDINVTGKIRIDTGEFVNQASIELPTIEWRNYSEPANQRQIGLSEEYNCNPTCARARLYEYDVTREQYYSSAFDPGKAKPAVLLAEGDIEISYGSTGLNRFGIISGNNVTISGRNAGASFANEDMHLYRVNYIRRVWARFDGDKIYFPTSAEAFAAADSVTPGEGSLPRDPWGGWALLCDDNDNCEDRRFEAASRADNFARKTGEVLLETQPQFNAGIFGKGKVELNGEVKNVGALPTKPVIKGPEELPRQDAPTVGVVTGNAGVGGIALPAPSSGQPGAQAPGTAQGSGRNTLNPGASPVALAPVLKVGANGLTTVVGANGLTFKGPNLNLPTSPNGLYVLAPANSTRYLVETDPLFVDGGAFGSTYLAERLGFDPNTVQKRLGDANYEAQLVRDQLIAQTNNFLLGGYTRAAEQMKGLLDSAASQSAALGLNFGVALTADQASKLTDDLVWMVETTVKGEKVLAPVVYLSEATRAAVLSGAVIAGRDVDISGASLTNAGGTIAASGKLSVTTQGDITNTGGAMRANTVALTSTDGSVVNQTSAVFMGDKLYGRTSIGPTGTITATDSLAIDARRDVRVTGANLAAGGNASIKAGNDVVLDTIQDKRVDTSAGGRDGNTFARNEVAVRQIGSTVSSGGALTITSGKDVTIGGSTVSAGGKLGIDAKGALDIVDRQDTKQVTEVKKTSSSGFTTKGASIGYAKTDTKETTKTRTGTSVGSSITSGGDATLTAGETLTVRGSDVAAGGDLAVKAKDVKVLAGQDTFEQTIDKKSTTTGVSIGVDVSAVTAAMGVDGKPSATEIARIAANAAGNQGVSVGLEHSTTTTHSQESNSTARVSTLTSGGKTSIKADDKALFEGTRVVAGGDIDVKAKTVDILEARNKTSYNVQSETTGLNVSVAIDPTAMARKAVAENLYSGGGDGVKLATVENTRRDLKSSGDKSAVASFTSGGNITREATGTLTEQGAQFTAAGHLIQKGAAINQLAATDRTNREETVTVNKGSIGVSVDFETTKAFNDLKSGKPGTAAGLLGGPSLGVDANYTRTSNTTSSQTTTAQTGKLVAGGRIVSESSGATRMEGTRLASGGDTSIAASSLQYDAARNTQTSTSSGNTINVDGRAEIGVGGNVGGKVGAGYKKDQGQDSASQAVTGSIASGGNLTIKTKGDARFEGTQLAAANNAVIEAGGKVDMLAAKDTTSSSNTSWGVSGEVNAAQGGKTGAGVTVNVEKDASSTSTARAGSIQAGNNLTIKATKDLTLVGTTVGAGKDASLSSDANVNLLAATSSSSSNSTKVDAGLSVARDPKSQGATAKAGVGVRDASATTETGSDIVAGNKLTINSGGKTDMQGTRIDAGKSAEIAATGGVTKRDAVSTSSEHGVQVDAYLQVAGKRAGEAPTSRPRSGAVDASPPTRARAGAVDAPATRDRGTTATEAPQQKTTWTKVKETAVTIKDGAVKAKDKAKETKNSSTVPLAWASKTDESDTQKTAVEVRTGDAADTKRLAQPVNLMAVPAVKSAVQVNAALAAPLAQYGSPAAIPDTVKRSILQQAGVATPPGADLTVLLKQTLSAGKDAAIQGLAKSNLNAEQHAAALQALGMDK